MNMTPYEALELRTTRGAHTTLTLQQLKDYVTAGDREISTGSVRFRHSVGQPASEWMPVEAFLAEHGKPAVARSQVSASLPPLPPLPVSRPRSTTSEQPNERPTCAAPGGASRSFAALSRLPLAGRFLRKSERDWFEPQMQFTIMGGAEKLPLLATSFIEIVEAAKYQGVKSFCASELPISPQMACLRVLSVSQTLFGRINAGCLSQVQLIADGPNLRVAVFSHPFKRVFLSAFGFSQEWMHFYIIVGIPIGMLISMGYLQGYVRTFSEVKGGGFFALVHFIVFGFLVWMALTAPARAGERLEKEFRLTQQAQLAALRSAVESSMIEATRDEALGIKERDIIHQKQ